MTWRRALSLLLLAAVALAVQPLALAPPRPRFETQKSTDKVCVFRYGGRESMFVVTPDGGIAPTPRAQRSTGASQVTFCPALLATSLKRIAS